MVGDRCGAAMDPAQGAAFFEKRKVAAHGLGRYPEAADQFVRTDRLSGVYRLDDRLMTFNRQHG
ncbi:hypothetical protein MBOE_04840 [Mycolicibacterium boenickei]|uniref:Uncharacterized protein n=1 Tax=Mycolicibacterium boenickei TaxID=146017 RepID=A0ABM7IPW6_9MYCO|nr:hypothetical protein MBOE_04840 [Mycolicibacterium boenickei]